MEMPENRYPKEVLLKDGSEVILRTPDLHDRDALVQFYRSLPPNDRWFFKEDPTDEKVIDKWLSNHFEKRAFCVLAFHEKKHHCPRCTFVATPGGKTTCGPSAHYGGGSLPKQTFGELDDF